MNGLCSICGRLWARYDTDASAVEAYQRGTDGDDDAGETPPAPPK